VAEGTDVSARRGQDGAPNSLDVALGLRIRLRREALGLSLTALANAVCLTTPQLWKFERGRNQVGFSRLVDIAHALGCRIVDLTDDLDDASAATPAFRQDIPYLRTPGAAELLEAYCDTPPNLRWTILKLMEEIAEDQLRSRQRRDVSASKLEAGQRQD
jgi:transcriptional regulator with XRE-family HTH domain